MLARGVVVSYETIRSWCAKFGPAYANQLRWRPPPRRQVASRRGLHRHQRHDPLLWRAVDQHANVLDIVVQPRRNAVAAEVLQQTPQGPAVLPRVIVTDGLRTTSSSRR